MVFTIEAESGVDAVESVFEAGALLLQAAKIARAASARGFFMMASLC